METEQHSAPLLNTGRKPVNGAKDKTMGNQVLNDSLIIIISCWVLIALIWYSLRNSNI